MKTKDLPVRKVQLMGPEPVRRRKPSKGVSRNWGRAQERYRARTELVHQILAGVGPWLEQRREKKLAKKSEKTDPQGA